MAIWDIEPHEISRDMKGKIFVLYGEPKIGKTTFATRPEKTLLLAFEKGYNALPNVIAQDIDSWATMKKTLRELKDPKAKAAFDHVAIDTVDIAYDMCEKYICAQQGVSNPSDIPYGGGWSLVKKEFKDTLKDIPMLGYGLTMISHAKSVTDSEDDTVSRVQPTLGGTARNIVLPMGDLIMYAMTAKNPKTGDLVPILNLRSNGQFEAGSRYKHIKPVIPFEYDAFLEALSDAIEKEEELGNKVTDEAKNLYEEVEKRTFDELRGDINKLIGEIVKTVPQDDEDAKLQVKTKIEKALEESLGKGKDLKSVTEEQYESIEVLEMLLKDLL